MQVILLIYDEMEKKEVKVLNNDPVIRWFDLLIGLNQSYRTVEVECNCARNNSIDRAKMLIRYVRKQLKLEKSQITFLRTSQFETGAEVKSALEYLFEKYDKEDVLFYCTGHGISWKDRRESGWSFGKKIILYRSLRKIFRKFSGRLVFINDCCRALAVDNFLKPLGNRYVLFGSCRKNSVTSNSVLNSVLGYWYHKMRALPAVSAVGTWERFIMDIPEFAIRGTYYNCGLGSDFHLLKKYDAGKMPSLRRGTAEFDNLFFPV